MCFLWWFWPKNNDCGTTTDDVGNADTRQYRYVYYFVIERRQNNGHQQDNNHEE